MTQSDVFSIAFSNSFQFLHRQDANAAAFKADPAFLLPKAQLPVGALPRHADNAAKIPLGDGYLALACSTDAMGQAQEGLGKPGGKGKEHETFGLLSCLSQPRAQDLDELERNLRFFPHQRQKVPTLDDEQFTISDRYGIGRTDASVEQGDFPKNITLGHEIEHSVMAVDRGHGYFNHSVANREQTRTRIVLCKNDGASPHRLLDGAGHQAIDMLQVKLAEKIVALKHTALFGFTLAEQSLVGAWHGRRRRRNACIIDESTHGVTPLFFSERQAQIEFAQPTVACTDLNFHSCQSMTTRTAIPRDNVPGIAHRLGDQLAPSW